MNPQSKESGGLDVFDDSDHDEIFNDDDDDDVAVDRNAGTPLDISDLLKAGASAIVAPMQKVIHKEDNKKASASDDNNSDSEDDTDSDEEETTKKKSGHGSDSGEDYTDDEDEGEDGYKPGGYHRVKVGEVYNQRYVVIKKLGWGHFSTVWMVKDRRSPPGSKEIFFALKVQKSAEHYTEAAMDEVELLDCISKERKAVQQLANKGEKDSDGVAQSDEIEFSKYTAILHDSFFHNGPNGRHMCMVFSMLGCNLLSVIKAYNYRGIPIPVVKNMIRGICKGLDFLHRKCHIIHTDLKPENVLLQFDQGVDSLTDSMGAMNLDGHSQDVAVSISDLEKQLENENLTQEERKKIRRKLKKRRQKERKRTGADTGESSDEGLSDDSTDELAVDNQFLSDTEMSNYLYGAGYPTENSETGKIASNVKRRLSHSAFVTTNFGSRHEAADEKLMEVMRESVGLRQLSSAEMAADLKTAEDNGGVAEVAFLLRAFTPEEGLAEGISSAFDGIGWEFVDEVSTREWRCRLSVPSRSRIHHEKPTASFKMYQYSRKNGNEEDRQLFSDLAVLIGANLSGDGDPLASTNQNSKKALPFAVCKALFPAKSTFAVLSFLESRFRGVVFTAYKREDGKPALDNIIFGPEATKICKHPMVMKTKSEGEEQQQASSIVGFDLRLVKDFAALPSLGRDGKAAYDLRGPSMDRVVDWWTARNPMNDRVRACTGVDPLADGALGLARDGNHGFNGDDFREGGKKAGGGAVNSANMGSIPKPSPSNLKDKDALMKSKAVIVDLGNACWTHRHFSEDIQTRQYRAPEVLIGSKYDTSADIWSLGCMTFELLTGDLLFDPRAGEDYDRDEDHLAMFQELLGKMPKKLALEGKYSKQFFDKKGNLKHIKTLKFWPVQDVLVEKYHYSKEDAQAVADFMTPLLDFDPKSRSTALDALRSKWLNE
eukprot:CAMPEP_0113651034 /NCGR_PEP_ID=MMETSP0017_2-20120614/27189_1 /TAXON_ID=2856 /ORGANISM="Cylindrotheca closterium" /LENGTH=939 /DNA_ID=CAMNT_0000563651 /DNA_START=238 /DNA_END=3057 /DNA_ORIENTATION=+ /assembly_acc=CAM_ASM_000147